MADTVGQLDIRGENIERAVKGFALKKFKIRQVCMISKSNNNMETYYKETNTILTGKTGLAIKDVARGARFPTVHPSWTKTSAVNIKYAAENQIFMEDLQFNAIDVQARTLLRVGEAIADSIDTGIYDTLTAATGTSGDVAAAAQWNHPTASTRDPIGDILIGIAAIQANNYEILSNGYLLMRAIDYSSLLRNSKVINNPSFKTADVVSNGRVGQICGLTIIQSESVDADEVMIIMGNRAATWKSAQGMKVATKEDPGIKLTVRAWEIGHTQVTDPQAIYTITGTQV